MRLRRSRLSRLAGLVVVMIAACPVTGYGQESVQVAQALYASAAYDEALAVLDRIQQQQPAVADTRAVNQQRALCLLALGRAPEAELAIAAVVQADPAYRPDDSTSPRVRAAFKDVRTRLLPGIIQSQYAEARRLYDARSWKPAAEAFRMVLALSNDPDLDPAQVEGLNDLTVLADGFVKLAEVAATPPPPAPPAPAEPEPPPPPAIDYDKAYDGTEGDVTPPLTLRQDVPAWTNTTVPMPRRSGTLEIIIAKDGTIERATITQSIVSFYDRQLLDATKHWRYRPAQYNGQPVRFKKMIRIAFE